MILPQSIRRDFPIFKEIPKLIYLDSTATSLKPQKVIDKENEYYTKYTANIFRGIYKISEQATQEYENSRIKVAQFINANSPNEVVFVRNATEAVNLVKYCWADRVVDKNSEIITTIMEHHANFVPWQVVCEQKNARLQIVGINEDGMLKENELLEKVNQKTKLVAFCHVSNVLGTINPVKKLIKLIKKKNPQVLVLIDGAQAVPHMPVDVQDLGCDFYIFSSHKMLGPTGIGVLWGKLELLDQMPPFQYGGEMIQAVYLDHSEYKNSPHRFEAGTPHIAGVIALGAAIEYLQTIGFSKIHEHEKELTEYALKSLTQIKGLKVFGPSDLDKKAGIVAFVVDKIHAHDIAQILDSNNICIRSGHHCAMPLHLYLKTEATARLSFYVYSQKADVDELVKALKKAQKILR